MCVASLGGVAPTSGYHLPIRGVPSPARPRGRPEGVSLKLATSWGLGK